MNAMTSPIRAIVSKLALPAGVLATLLCATTQADVPFFDPATNIVGLDSVRVGSNRYGPVVIQVDRIGAVTAAPADSTNGGSVFYPGTNMLYLPKLNTTTAPYQFNSSYNAVLDRFTVLAASADQTVASAARVAPYVQGSYVFDCGSGGNSILQTVTIDAAGNLNMTGSLGNATITPADPAYQLKLVIQNSIGSSGSASRIESPLGIFSLESNGNLSTSNKSSINFSNGSQICNGVSGKLPPLMSDENLSAAFAGTALLHCFSAPGRIGSGTKTVTLDQGANLIVGDLNFGSMLSRLNSSQQGYMVSTSVAGVEIVPIPRDISQIYKNISLTMDANSLIPNVAHIMSVNLLALPPGPLNEVTACYRY